MNKKEWKMATGIAIDLTMEFSKHKFYTTTINEFGCSAVEDIIEHIVCLITPYLFAKQCAKETPDTCGKTYHDIWIMISEFHAEQYFKDPYGGDCYQWDGFDKGLVECVRQMFK